MKNEKFLITFIGQAGFLLNTDSGVCIAVDPYLSNECEHLFGFARMIPPPIAVDDFSCDLLLATHSHADHLDMPLAVHLAENKKTVFAGARDCAIVSSLFAPGLSVLLSPGDAFDFGNINIAAVPADHGDMAPLAVGFVISLCGKRIYFTGDTSENPAESLPENIDIMIVPINPAYGNPGGTGAVRLIERVAPTVAIACHFGMFAEHGGDPETLVMLAAASTWRGRLIIPEPKVPLHFNEEK